MLKDNCMLSFVGVCLVRVVCSCVFSVCGFLGR